MIAAVLLGYLLGSVPFGLVFTRAAGLGDIRLVGSGNIGATNVLRAGGKGLAAATLLADGGKGVASVLLAGWAQGGAMGPAAALWAGLGAVLGHLFPVWLRFRGGKGVATGLGVLLAAAPLAGVVACVVWLVVAKLGRRSSLAGLVGFAAAVVAAWWVYGGGRGWLALAVAALIFARHHANIRRLLAGTEPRIGESVGRETG